MRGQVLVYSIQTNSGFISGEDGNRYAFSGSDIKDNVMPIRGMFVDFEVEGQNAIAIYRGLGKVGFGANPGTKSKALATLLGAFLGGFGAHKFYMGSWGWGIVYLLTCWLYIPFIIALVEWVRYVLMTDEEFQTKAEEFKDKGPFGFFW